MFYYQYDFKDYLGNVRGSYQKNTANPPVAVLVQEDEYYAFGLRRNQHNKPNNSYLYNGKEEQTDLTNQYDYGARFYDPVIARWVVIDPLVELGQESTSPYIYVYNNPIKNTDPDGRFPDDDSPGVASVTYNLGKGVAESAWSAVTGVYDAVAHPIETAKALHSLTTPQGAVNAAANLTLTGVQAVDKFQNGDANVKANMLGFVGGEVAQMFIGAGEAKLGLKSKALVSLDASALIGAVEGGGKTAVKAAIGDATPIVSRTAAKEFLAGGNKAALKEFMKESGAKIGGKGASTSLIKKLQDNAKRLGRNLGLNDASIIGSAINNGATVITNDKRMTKFMKAANLQVKGY